METASCEHLIQDPFPPPARSTALAVTEGQAVTCPSPILPFPFLTLKDLPHNYCEDLKNLS